MTGIPGGPGVPVGPGRGGDAGLGRRSPFWADRRGVWRVLAGAGMFVGWSVALGVVAGVVVGLGWMGWDWWRVRRELRRAGEVGERGEGFFRKR